MINSYLVNKSILFSGFKNSFQEDLFFFVFWSSTAET